MSDERKKWAELFRRLRYRVLEEASANVLRVFVALESFVGGDDGYAYPSIAALQKKTQIKKRDTIFDALCELESLGIVYRRKLGSYTRGFVAPNLYRIGVPIVAVPERARRFFYLADESPRSARVGRDRRPEKGDGDPTKPSKNAANRTPTRNQPRDVGVEEGDVPKNGVLVRPEKGDGATSRQTGPELNVLELSEEELVEENLNVKSLPPIPACSVGLRQDHAAEMVQELEPRKNGGPLVLSLAPANAGPPVPAVIAYFWRHGRLPDYIPDPSHVLFDSQRNFCGYIGRDGKRYTEWNEFESIEMATRRRTREAIRENKLRLDELPMTGEEKLAMLRKGTVSADQAAHWSARTGVPAHVYLEKDDFARAEAFKQWKATRDGEKR